MNEPNLQQPPNSSPLQNDQILESTLSIKQSPGHIVPDQQNQEHNNIDYNNIVPYHENVSEYIYDNKFYKLIKNLNRK